MHRVEAGQSLASIARQYKASPMQIATANGLKGGEPSEGDRLLVPATYREVIPALKTPRTAKAKAGVKRPAVTAAAKHPVHPPATGTLAQLKDHSRPSLNR
jgi:LysM repeat protein